MNEFEEFLGVVDTYGKGKVTVAGFQKLTEDFLCRKRMFNALQHAMGTQFARYREVSHGLSPVVTRDDKFAMGARRRKIQYALHETHFSDARNFVNDLLETHVSPCRISVESGDRLGVYRPKGEIMLNGCVVREIKELIYTHEFTHRVQTETRNFGLEYGLFSVFNDPLYEGHARAVERKFAEHKFNKGSRLEIYFDAKETVEELEFACARIAQRLHIPFEQKHKERFRREGWEVSRFIDLYALGHSFFYLWEQQEGQGVYKRVFKIAHERSSPKSEECSLLKEVARG